MIRILMTASASYMQRYEKLGSCSKTMPTNLHGLDRPSTTPQPLRNRTSVVRQPTITQRIADWLDTGRFVGMIIAGLLILPFWLPVYGVYRLLVRCFHRRSKPLRFGIKRDEDWLH